MDVRPVDPRDIEWEDDAPIFRLVFWRRRTAPPPNLARGDAAYDARELEISGAEVGEILRWAQAEAVADESFTLHLVVRCPNLGLGQVLIAGSDPTAANDRP